MSDHEENSDEEEMDRGMLMRFLSQIMAAQGGQRRVPPAVANMLGIVPTGIDPEAARTRRLARFHPSRNIHEKELEQRETVKGLELAQLLREESEAGVSAKSVSSLLRRRAWGGITSRARRGRIAAAHIPNKLVRRLRFGRQSIYGGIFSSSGERFVASSQGEIIGVFDGSTMALQKRFEARGVRWTVSSTDVTPDDAFLLYSSLHPVLHMVNLTGEFEQHEELPLSRGFGGFAAYQARFSAGGREVVAACGDGCIRVLDVERKQTVVTEDAHEGVDINSVVFADAVSQPDVFVSGSDDWTLRVWDRRILGQRGSRPQQVLAGHLAGVTFLDAKGDGRHILSNAKDQTVKVWDLRMAKPSTSEFHDISEMEHRLAYDYRMGDAPHWGHKLWHPDDSSVMTYRGHEVAGTLIRARFSPWHSSGGAYIYSGSHDGKVYIWNTLSGELVDVLVPPSAPALIRDVAWHPRVPKIVASTFEATLEVFEAFRDPDHPRPRPVPAHMTEADLDADLTHLRPPSPPGRARRVYYGDDDDDDDFEPEDDDDEEEEEEEEEVR